MDKLKHVLNKIKTHPALLLAAKTGNLELTDLLLKKGALIDARGMNEETPILAASENNHHDVAHFLIENNAKLCLSDENGNSMLHIACKHCYPEIAELVLQCSKSISLLRHININNETPIERANNEEMIRFVLVRAILRFDYNKALSYGPPETPPIERQITQKGNGRAIEMHRQLKYSMINPLSPLPASNSHNNNNNNNNNDDSESLNISHLFWRAIGNGKDSSFIFQNFNVYPFDRLQDSERVVVLTRVAQAMSGYKTDIERNILNGSALYAVFAMIKKRISHELETNSGTNNNNNNNSNNDNNC